jgi:hypothetical protein
MEPLTPYPPAYPTESKMLTMSREKFDQIIQKAMNRAARPTKAANELLKQRIALVAEELRLTRLLTKAYLNQ